jgi:uncharacterized protein
MTDTRRFRVRLVRHLRALGALGILAAVLVLALPAAPARASEYVLDEADVIDAATEARLEALSLRVENETPGAEIAVVTVDSLDGNEIEEFAEEKFNELGIGNKEFDNGILLLVAPNEKRVRIEVGYGLEGAIPDSRAGRILDDIILPLFKSGDMVGGIEAGHAEVARLVLEEYEASTEGLAPSEPDRFELPVWAWILIFFGGIGAFTWLMSWLAKKGYLKGGGGGGTSGPSSWGGSSGGGFGGGDSGGGGASGGW